MNTPTAARPTSRKDSHYYTVTGEPAYEIMGKSTGRPRPVTIADARKQNLVPSVTTILKLLHKEALVNWMIEQAVLAAMTTPRTTGEADDAFIHRILHEEKVQDQESQIARDRGTAIHDALEKLFTGQAIDQEIEPWVRPAFTEVAAMGQLVATEKILVGEGYAGKTDLVQESPGAWMLWDFKSAKKLPDPEKPAWPEHRLQLSAYAMAYSRLFPKDLVKPIQVANCYISTIEQGKFVIIEHERWEDAYWNGFAPLVKHWCWANSYSPVVEKREEPPVAKAVEAPKAPEPPKPAEPAKPKGPSTKMVYSQGVRTPRANPPQV
jgi:hypothetical protein